MCAPAMVPGVRLLKICAGARHPVLIGVEVLQAHHFRALPGESLPIVVQVSLPATVLAGDVPGDRGAVLTIGEGERDRA